MVMRIRVLSGRIGVALWAPLFFSVCLFNITPIAIAGLDQSALEFYAFSNSRCPPCVMRIAVLNSTYPEAKIIIHDLFKKENVNYLQRILNVLNETLLREVFPSIPLVGVFEYNTLKAITGGDISANDWRYVVEWRHEGVLLYFDDALSGYVNQSFEDVDKIALFEGLFKKSILNGGDDLASFFSLIVLVTLAALMDGINPCAVNIFIVFLTFVLFFVGRRGILKIGFSFAAAVFLVYFSLGLGFIRFLRYLPQIKYFIAAFAGTLGVLRIVDSLGIEVKFIPAALAEKLMARLESALTPWGGFFAGALTAALVLPCSSAPYFIALDLLSRRATFVSGLLLLVFYNLIIILPFIALTVGVHAFSLSTMDIKLWAKEKRRWINLLIGIVLISLCLTTLL